jgi:hypothetical protein
MPDNATPRDALVAEIDKTVETLDHLYMQMSRALKDASQISDFAPELLPSLNTLQVTLQIHLDLLSRLQPQGVPQAPQPVEATKAHESREDHESAQEAVKKTRRSRDPGLDFLLLEAFEHKNVFGYPIGQQTLHELACKLDPNAKRGSLVAKLNRWKNDQNLLTWSDSNDLHITEDGRAHRDKLYNIVMRDGHAARLKQAFKAAWNRDVNFRKP